MGAASVISGYSAPLIKRESVSPLKILILGGTSFLGPHQIAYALSRGHSITTFTRGKSMPTVHKDLFSMVESRIGDRNDSLKAIETGKWDVVIDNSGHKTQWTRDTAQLLKDRTSMYVYTSSTGVYYPYLTDDITERTKVLLKEPEGTTEETKLEFWYGVMKATSEQEARDAYGNDRVLVVRPTYMVGPADKLDRFIHWPIRLAKGGEVLVPGKIDDPVQFIDVRDVAEFTIRLIEQRVSGTFNVVGPKDYQTMRGFVREASQPFEKSVEFTYVDDYAFLKDQNVPYIVPWIMSEGNNYGSARISNSLALQRGLSFRDLKTTMMDTYHWWYSDALSQGRRDRFEKNAKTVLSREKDILKAWKMRGSK